MRNFKYLAMKVCKTFFYILIGIVTFIPFVVALYWVSKQPTS